MTADLGALLGAVDAVIVASPAATHAAVARQVLEAGKPVLVEKPFALTVRDAEAVAKEGARRGIPVLAGHLLVYHPAVERLREMVQNGELGKVFYLYGLRVNLGQVRKDANALWSFGPHDVSMALYLLGEQPVRVAAQGKSYLQPAIEGVVFLTMEFASGVLAHVQMSWLDPHKERKLTVVGAKKMVVSDDMEPREKRRSYDKGPHRHRWRGRSRLRRTAARNGACPRRLPRARRRREPARCRFPQRGPLAHSGRPGRHPRGCRTREAVFGHGRSDAAQGAGRHLDQCADAAVQDQRPRCELRARRDRIGEARPAQGAAGRTRVHNLSRHHTRADAAGARIDGSESWRGLLPRVFAGARGPGQRPLQYAQHSQGRGRHHAQLPETGDGAVSTGDRHADPGFLAGSGRAREDPREYVP